MRLAQRWSVDLTLRELEEQQRKERVCYLRAMLEQFGSNRAELARRLGRNRTQMYRIFKAHGIAIPPKIAPRVSPAFHRFATSQMGVRL